jgi:arylsulfatase
MQTDDDVDMTAARGRGLSVAKRGLCLLVGALASWVPIAAATQAPPGESPSTPDWSLPIAAPDGAPNIVLVLLDDVGFAATSTFGGATPTPSLDRLAAGGLRYNRFHVNPMCSPTRAALLSGRNSHQVGFGRISELASAHPGYNSVWPKASAGIAEVLRRKGYSTAAFGKWHNTPLWEATPAGPFDRWPAGLGFE